LAAVEHDLLVSEFVEKFRNGYAEEVWKGRGKELVVG
jgi:hypothetical protein